MQGEGNRQLVAYRHFVELCSRHVKIWLKSKVPGWCEPWPWKLWYTYFGINCYHPATTSTCYKTLIIVTCPMIGPKFVGNSNLRSDVKLLIQGHPSKMTWVHKMCCTIHEQVSKDFLLGLWGWGRIVLYFEFKIGSYEFVFMMNWDWPKAIFMYFIIWVGPFHWWFISIHGLSTKVSEYVCVCVCLTCLSNLALALDGIKHLHIDLTKVLGESRIMQEFWAQWNCIHGCSRSGPYGRNRLN